jgi:hypothetical protein
MGVKTKPITDYECYEIKGHTISKDDHGNCRGQKDLTSKELFSFKQYENLIIKNSRFKKHTRAVYKS